MAKTIKGTLSVKSIHEMQKELKAYKEQLISKCETFTKRLSEIGIETAKMRLSGSTGTEEREMASHITFSTEVNPSKNGVKTLMVASSGSITRTWVTGDGTKSVDVSPLLMVEFGSGLRANNDHGGQYGMGQGTFPGQTHASDPDGWYWKTNDDEWHHSFGISPAMPMYHAYKAMVDKIYDVAKEVFG